MEMIIKFKIHVTNENGESRSKMVTIKGEKEEMYQLLQEKLRTQFKELHDIDIFWRLFWKDDDKEEIDIDNQDDLEEAVDNFDSQSERINLWIEIERETGNIQI